MPIFSYYFQAQTINPLGTCIFMLQIKRQITKAQHIRNIFLNWKHHRFVNSICHQQQGWACDPAISEMRSTRSARGSLHSGADVAHSKKAIQPRSWHLPGTSQPSQLQGGLTWGCKWGGPRHTVSLPSL